MVLWLAFGSIFGVWNVFQSPGLDFRLIALGALLPLVLDAPFRSQAYAHTLLVRGRRARAHDGAHRRARAPAAPPARAEPRDRLVHEPRARAVRGRTRRCSGGRRSAPRVRTRRCSRRWPCSSSRSCSGSRRRGGRGAGSGSPIPRGGATCGARAGSRSRSGRPMISFVRHGETAHNRDGRLQGRVDLELSRARARAGRAARRPVRRRRRSRSVFSSPLRRARADRGRDRRGRAAARSRSTTG